MPESQHCFRSNFAIDTTCVQLTIFYVLQVTYLRPACHTKLAILSRPPGQHEWPNCASFLHEVHIMAASCAFLSVVSRGGATADRPQAVLQARIRCSLNSPAQRAPAIIVSHASFNGSSGLDSEPVSGARKMAETGMTATGIRLTSKVCIGCSCWEQHVRSFVILLF
jgi:hypothetical protein